MIYFVNKSMFCLGIGMLVLATCIWGKKEIKKYILSLLIPEALNGIKNSVK